MRIVFLYFNKMELMNFKSNLSYYIKMLNLKIVGKNCSQIILDNNINISFKRININRATDLSVPICNGIKFATAKSNKNIIKDMEKRLEKKMDTVFLSGGLDVLNLILTTEEKTYYKVNINTLEIEEVIMKEYKELVLYELYFEEYEDAKTQVKKIIKQKIDECNINISRFKETISKYEKQLIILQDINSKLK